MARWIHLLPMRGTARDLFTSAAALLVMTPVVAGSAPHTLVLEALFDLTPAEARVARGIAEARSLDAIAQTHNLSKETVRAQLKNVFAKTGTGRQVELAGLLAALPRI